MGVKGKQDDHRNLSQLLQTMKQWIDTQIKLFAAECAYLLV
jgi:hypothetical protein